MNRFRSMWILLFAGAVGSVQAQAPTAELLCEGYSNWVSTIAFPTSDERVRFVGPLDRSYPSACDAQQGSDLVFSIDEANHTVELNIVVPPGGGGACPRIYAPVYALAVEFGPLAPGEWVFSSTSYAFTNTFHVYSSVPAPLLTLENEMGQIRLRWPAVFYLHYEIESSSTLPTGNQSGSLQPWMTPTAPCSCRPPRTISSSVSNVLPSCKRFRSFPRIVAPESVCAAIFGSAFQLSASNSCTDLCLLISDL
jgi:hypothetical protein